VTVPDNLICWIGLNLGFQERFATLQKIARAYHPIQEAFRAKPHDLKALGIENEGVRALVSGSLLERARREQERLEQLGFGVITRDSEAYPEYLREIYDPPGVLYYRGDIKQLQSPSVSVVGARKPSPYGQAVAEKLASDLAGRGLVVVSGLARGIDSIAHWGALQTGKTTAVVGSGLDTVYPRENRKLLQKVAENGVVITEYPLKSPPLAHHFPLRNRIISGLSLAVVVVEATRKSGTLITARMALEQNREVLAVPGNITSELSRGTNWLIKHGARVVENWEDVVDELPAPWNEELRSGARKERGKPPSLSAQENRLYSLLPSDRLKHVDELVAEMQLSVSEVLALLLNLELKGLVSQRPGHNYQRKL
jgi:DNA processing protein